MTITLKLRRAQVFVRDVRSRNSAPIAKVRLPGGKQEFALMTTAHRRGGAQSIMGALWRVNMTYRHISPTPTKTPIVM